MELGGDPCYEGSVDCAAVNCFSFALLPLCFARGKERLLRYLLINVAKFVDFKFRGMGGLS